MLPDYKMFVGILLPVIIFFYKLRDVFTTRYKTACNEKNRRYFTFHLPFRRLRRE